MGLFLLISHFKVMNMIFNILGSLMAFWYIAYRWVYLADKAKYSWAYENINVKTAMWSIPFIIITLFPIDKLTVLLQPDKPYYSILYAALCVLFYLTYVLGIFLLARNSWYTAEDLGPLIKMYRTPWLYPIAEIRQQILFVAIDIMMALYVALWIIRYKAMVL